ncbi:hypothetical protein ABPG73_008931 [Tetrahymena malaccensis]
MYFFIFSILLSYIYSQEFETCSKQNTYYDIVSQQCGTCQDLCKLCDDYRTCLQCQPNSYYDLNTNKCVNQCKKGDFQQEYFQICIQCQVENCETCQIDGQLCQQCKQGWQLSSDQKYCLKNECLASQYSFYNPATGSCTTNCPSSSNINSRSCDSIKQFSQIKSLASRNKIIQGDIQNVYYFDQIQGEQIVVTLNAVQAVLYSYPGLIPMNQIILLSPFSVVAQDSQSLFLISNSNVQKINMQQQSISIVYEEVYYTFSFSKTQLYLFSSNYVTTYNLSDGQQKIYQINQLISVDFQPYSFNVSDNSNGNSSSPNDPQPPGQDSNKPQIQTILDSQGCLMINSTIQQTPTIQNINVFKRDFLLESQIIQQKIVNIYQAPNSPQSFQSLDNVFTSYIDSNNNQINLYFLNLNLQIQSLENSIKNISVLYTYQYDGKTRIIVIQPNYYNGIFQSAIVCANLTQNATSKEYYFEYDMPHYAQQTSQIIDQTMEALATYSLTKKLDAFLLVNQYNQVYFMKNQIFKIQMIKLVLPDSQSQLGYYGVVQSRNTILVYIMVSQQTINILNYNSCIVQSAQLQGLSFLTVAGRTNPIYSIIDNDLDTIIIMSQNRLNIFQYSTLKFLGLIDYNSYFSDNIIYYNDLSNFLAIQQASKLQFQLFDLWTPLFTNLYQNSLKSQRNRFIFNPGTNTVLYLNYNSNLLSVFNSNNYQIVSQFKFQDSLSATQYFTLLFQISNSSVLAITSSSELVIYDFTINQQVKYLSSSFNCFLYSNYTSDIYCLEYNNVLKKFDYTALDFSIVADQDVIQIQVTEFVALSKSILAFISPLGKMILLNPITLQVSPTISIQQQIDKHQEFQRRTISLNQNLIKYTVQMTIQYSSLDQIQIFQNIFSQQTIIEYQFIIQQNQIQRKGIANLTDSSFLQPQFYILSFQTIILQINLSQSNFVLNQYGNLRTLKFNNVDFIFDSNSQSNFLISNLEILILDQINIQDQQINGNYSNIMIVNVTNVLISNISISNIKITNQPLFSFQNVTNLTIIDLNLLNLDISQIIFYFFDCQMIQINQINIQKLTLQSGNIFAIFKSSLVQISNIKATQISQTTQIIRVLKSVQRELQNSQKILIATLFNLQGCYNASISNLQFENLIETGFLQSNHYALSDQLQYFSKLILIQNITFQKIQLSNQNNQLFSIVSLQAQLNQINITSISSFTNLISLSIQNDIQISNSFFSKINLQKGSIISIIQGQLILRKTNFSDSSSQGLPCAINIYQANLINITTSSFINLNNNLNKVNQTNGIVYYQGGAIGIQSSKYTLIQNSLFQNCSSLKQGGAIYSSQQMEDIFTIQMSNFIENESTQSSGGAIFLSQIGGINITKSNFTKNKALFQNGGAISLDSSNIQQFSDNTFSFNEASIGGSIYYQKINSNLFDKNQLILNNIALKFNKASFYGNNIGSIPKYIGITTHPYLDTLKIEEEYSIHNIASGNYLEKKLYLNFIDEENNPFNFIGSDIYYDRSQFYFQLNPQNNSQTIIQEGLNTILNKTIGMFELNFQSLYKISQNQQIYIISNQFESGYFLSMPLNLHFRNCVVGEIVQESNQFIVCDQCVQGRYSLKIPDMDKDVNQIQCVSCPEQAQFCQGSEIQLKDGYWRENNLTDQIYTCLLESCSFGNPQNKEGCLKGYVGPLCNSCDSKQSFWGEQYGLKDKNCYPCSEQLKQIAFVCFFIFFYAFYIAMSQQSIIASKIRIIKLKIFKQIGLLITSNQSSSGNEVSLCLRY